MHAVLLDLWDTTAWGEIPPEEERLATQLGVADAVLFDAFERTRRYRGTGGPSTTEESLAVVVDACGVELDRDAVRRIADVHIAWLRRGVHLYDDTLPVLRELRGRGIRTAIVSNCDHFTRPAVEALGLEEEVDAVVLSFEVGAISPTRSSTRRHCGGWPWTSHRRPSWTTSPTTATGRPPSGSVRSASTATGRISTPTSTSSSA